MKCCNYHHKWHMAEQPALSKVPWISPLFGLQGWF